MENTRVWLETMKPFLQTAWRQAGFKEPTAVQQKAIPLILNGSDVIAESPTGTGKTLAYLLPILEKVQAEKKDPQAVILAPTRELVMQIYQQVQAFAQGSGITGASFIGGADRKRQLEKLKKHPQVIVGTPGRIRELAAAKKLKMHEVKTIVVDEVDQILQMNMMDEVKEIVRATLRDRQLLFISATVSEQAERIGREMMKQPELIRITRQQLPASPIEHLFIVCERREKMDVLRRLIRMEKMKALAFVNDTADLEQLASKLRYKQIPMQILHGESKTAERESVMKNFRAGKFPLLVATDLAARGLDIQGLTHVINYDLPDSVEQYIHRSGRTGRMGTRGTIISLVTEREAAKIRKFSQALQTPIERRWLYMGKMINEKPAKHKSARKISTKPASAKPKPQK